MLKNVLLIRSTDAQFEPRYTFIRENLNNLGFKVVEVNWSRSKSAPEVRSLHRPYIFSEKAPYGAGVKNFKLHFKFAKFIIRTIRSVKPHMIYCCDLDTFIPSMLANRSCILIFDQFDPISARLNIPRPLEWLLDLAESLIVQRAKIRVTVNKKRIPFILKFTFLELPNKIDLNCKVVESKSLREKSLKSKTLFYGGTLSSDRGLENVVSVMSQIPNWRLVIFGFGPELDKLCTLQTRNVTVYGKVDHTTLITYAAKSDAILALYDPGKRNNRLTSSNKLFEACQLRIPLITNSKTMLGDIVAKYGLGLITEYHDKNSVIKALNELSRMSEREITQIGINMERYIETQSVIFQETRLKFEERVSKYANR